VADVNDFKNILANFAIKLPKIGDFGLKRSKI
jgi:hypothetical protein